MSLYAMFAIDRIELFRDAANEFRRVFAFFERPIVKCHR